MAFLAPISITGVARKLQHSLSADSAVRKVEVEQSITHYVQADCGKKEEKLACLVFSQGIFLAAGIL
jgi:hypothetical protein